MPAVPREEDTMLTLLSLPSRVKKSGQVFAQLSNDKADISWEGRKEAERGSGPEDRAF